MGDATPPGRGGASGDRRQVSAGAQDRQDDDHGAASPAKADAITVARIEASVPTLVTSRDLTERFAEMVRHGRAEQLPDWLTEAETSVLSSFARGLRADVEAVAAALREPWSNGQTEGQINRLKTLKRQMYGRANLDLLRARLVVVA
jgi:transposase